MGHGALSYPTTKNNEWLKSLERLFFFPSPISNETVTYPTHSSKIVTLFANTVLAPLSSLYFGFLRVSSSATPLQDKIAPTIGASRLLLLQLRKKNLLPHQRVLFLSQPSVRVSSSSSPPLPACPAHFFIGCEGRRDL